MKAIQIGDWLQHANGKYYQVTRIDRLGDGNIHFACGFPHLWEYNNKFKPIPLEKIHLVKNGFKADEKDEIFTYYEGYKVIVDFDDIFDGNAYLRIDFADKHLDIEIEYIHELQQTMRIMGCDKEIEL